MFYYQDSSCQLCLVVVHSFCYTKMFHWALPFTDFSTDAHLGFYQYFAIFKRLLWIFYTHFFLHTCKVCVWFVLLLKLWADRQWVWTLPTGVCWIFAHAWEFTVYQGPCFIYMHIKDWEILWEGNGWIIGYINFQLYKIMTNCLPTRFYRFIFPPLNNKNGYISFNFLNCRTQFLTAK